MHPKTSTPPRTAKRELDSTPPMQLADTVRELQHAMKSLQRTLDKTEREIIAMTLATIIALAVLLLVAH